MRTRMKKKHWTIRKGIDILYECIKIQPHSDRVVVAIMRDSDVAMQENIVVILPSSKREKWTWGREEGMEEVGVQKEIKNIF